MAKLFDLGSLRGKISSAYIIQVFSIILLGAISYFGLLFIENKVTEGEAVSDLKVEVLEMRREENNLFLYQDIDALKGALEHARQSIRTLHKHNNVLKKMLEKSDYSFLNETLEQYRSKLAQWQKASWQQQDLLQKEIRFLGHNAYLSVEALSRKEREILEKSINEAQWFLIASLFFIVVSIFMIGRHLQRVAVTPLRLLEQRLKPIAEGRFNHLDEPSRDQEFVTFTDAFNRMLKELEIRQKRMMQSEKLASLGILAAGVAHELNNPLSNISSSCQLLIEELDEADPKTLRNWLDQIDSETVRGKNIVRTLLDFGSQKVFHKTPVHLAALMNETRIIIGKSLLEHDSELTLNIPEQLVVEIDKQRFQQLFINLIQNALHAGKKNVQISISAICCGSNPAMIPDHAQVVGNIACLHGNRDKMVEIIVADNGPGIPEQQVSRIFDPFFTTSEPGNGVGLGLYIVQEIVQEHDGCLAISTRPQQGTQIIILLPEQES